MLGQRREIPRLQSDFYRDQYHKILRWLIACVVVIFILIGAIVYMLMIQPQQSYYASTTEGKILAMPAAAVLSNKK